MSAYQSSFVYTRRSPRIAAELPADFRILLPNKDLERYSLKIKTLSGGGLSFLSPLLLSVGTQIEMMLYDLTVQIIFTAEVTWIDNVLDSKTKAFRCGLKFTHISDEDLARIYRIVTNSLGISFPPASF
jgi:c-di-GMP-binding flagellar brake protein YcgR